MGEPNRDTARVAGSLYTDARNFVRCPRCEAGPGGHCRQPAGRKSPTPHAERVRLLLDERPDVAEASRRRMGRLGSGVNGPRESIRNT